jgi:hypothetical protein
MLLFHKLYAGIASAIILVTLIWGFVLVGSPLSERQRRFDERRIEDLQSIHQQILQVVYEGRPFFSEEQPKPVEPLPDTLDTVAKQATFQRIQIRDPQTDEPYEYRISGDTTYELCATFNTGRDEPFNIFWNHPAGNHCFRFDVTNPSDGYADVPAEEIPLQKRLN